MLASVCSPLQCHTVAVFVWVYSVLLGAHTFEILAHSAVAAMRECGCLKAYLMHDEVCAIESSVQTAILLRYRTLLTSSSLPSFAHYQLRLRRAGCISFGLAISGDS